VTVRAGTGRQRKKATNLSKSGLEVLDSLYAAPQDPRDAYEAERAAIAASRRCIATGCDEHVPWPTHGTPAEDHAEWLRAGTR